ncbi:DUF4012 domain-containing protein [Nonomuraea sp. NPDC047897]|uniref:DUF4012 domain-containing protein n=1 Tax=Nonomuraea sp. NPDC047897 TaxID=3364346 RepID=UPI00371B9D6E
MPSRTRVNRRRIVAFGLLGPVACLALAGGWSARLGLNVREQLQATKDALENLPVGDPARLGGALVLAQRHAAEARRLTSGPDWSLLTHSPVVGEGATTIRGLAESAADLTGVLTGVHQAGTGLIRPGGFSVADLGKLLDGLDSAAPALAAAATKISGTRARLAATPADTGIAVVDEARATALREIDRLHGWLDAADDAAALLPAMLGREGPRRYFLAFQTNAEARATGGLVGAFGVLKAGRGGVTIEGLSSNSALPASPRPVVDHGAAYSARYGRDAQAALNISNLSPHFPYAAATWTALWERRHGRRLDGAIATDPVGLSHLLRLIGPVSLPGGEKLTADNVVDLTERQAYARYDDQHARKRFLMRIAGTVADAVTRSRPDPRQVLPVLSKMVKERRLQIWSRRDAEQRRLAATPLGGALPGRPGPYASLVINNSAGNKLDYYLDRQVEYQLGPCRADGHRVSRVRVRLVNDVPRRELPAYVTSRLDRPGRRHTPGSNLLWVSLYTAPGTRIGDVRIDGEPASVLPAVERSHPVLTTMLEFAPRQARTLEFHLLEPASPARPVVPVQPLARPQQTRVLWDTRGCAADG